MINPFELGLPSGKHTKNYGKSPFLMGQLTISMAMFNIYVSLPEGKPIFSDKPIVNSAGSGSPEKMVLDLPDQHRLPGSAHHGHWDLVIVLWSFFGQINELGKSWEMFVLVTSCTVC